MRLAAAGWNTQLGELVLRHDDVRTASDPSATLMEFLESTYRAAARLAGWELEELELHLPG